MSGLSFSLMTDLALSAKYWVGTARRPARASSSVSRYSRSSSYSIRVNRLGGLICDPRPGASGLLVPFMLAFYTLYCLSNKCLFLRPVTDERDDVGCVVGMVLCSLARAAGGAACRRVSPAGRGAAVSRSAPRRGRHSRRGGAASVPVEVPFPAPVQSGLSRDAASLPAAAPAGSRQAPVARHRAARHRHRLPRRLRESRLVHLAVSPLCRPAAVRLPPALRGRAALGGCRRPADPRLLAAPLRRRSGLARRV